MDGAGTQAEFAQHTGLTAAAVYHLDEPTLALHGEVPRRRGVLAHTPSDGRRNMLFAAI